MVQKIDTLFEQLKKTTPVIRNLKVPQSLTFKLIPTQQGLSLSIVDDSGKEVDPGYEFYSGPERSILKEISRVRGQDAFTIDWDEISLENRFYLNGNDYLLSLLACSDRFVDEKGKKILLAPGEARVRLTLSEKNNGLVTSMGLWQNSQQIKPMVPVTETHILSGHTLYKVKPLGRHFNSLSLFEARLGVELLEQYLTLVFSNLTGIEIFYSGYTLVQGEAKKTRPAVIFAGIRSWAQKNSPPIK